jgi:SAM-dependent methyltransferase
MSDPVGQAWADELAGRAYDTAPDAAFLRRFTRSPYIRRIVAYGFQPRGARVLEPGCGSGKFSLALAGLGAQVTVLDFVPSVLADVRRAARQGAGTLHFAAGSLESLPFADGTFDLALNEGVVEHWLDAARRLAVLREMARVVKPGGWLAVFVPNGAHPHVARWEAQLPAFRAAPPMTRYSAAALAAELAQAGLADVRADGIYPWRSWARLGAARRLYPLAAALDRLPLLPRRLRTRWAVNLLAVGRRP